MGGLALIQTLLSETQQLAQSLPPSGALSKEPAEVLSQVPAELLMQVPTQEMTLREGRVAVLVRDRWVLS